MSAATQRATADLRALGAYRLLHTRTLKRSEVLRWLSKVVEKVERLERRLEKVEQTARDTGDRTRISELEENLRKLERRHEVLLGRYNELEVRWPTLIKIKEVQYPPINRPQRYS